MGKMYEEAGCFDPQIPLTIQEGVDGELCQGLPPLMAVGTTHSNHNNFEENLRVSAEELSIQLQHQLAFNAHLLQDSPNHQTLSYEHSNWDPNNIQDMQDSSTGSIHQSFNLSSMQEPPYTPTPDLINLLHLPRCSASSLLPNSSRPSLGLMGDHLAVADSSSSSSVLYDHLFHLNLPPQPAPSFRELFQSLQPNGYTLTQSQGGSFFGGGEELIRDVSGPGSLYHDADDSQQFDDGVLEKGGKGIQHFVTEHQRRKHMNDKYAVLRNLVPNPTKSDRASVVRDAIEYIKELLRTVSELKLLVEKKRYSRERTKRHKTEEDATGDVDSSVITSMNPLGDSQQSFNGSLRSSWLQRKSKDTEVDVRIVEDEVTIKVVQRKKINCLLFVSKVLDELRLDLHHVAGGHIGDHYSFLFNTKIYEGSSLYASAIANKLIEVVDRQYASAPPTSCY
ncbi:hypothetical protein K2173_012699 [Erythroxylum novogranatense]|uniref:BHLH domain-containing protein n=1 Tax=Erythroxylum novogranatense TaxID=1862640 RepID=A0AAV8TTB4_9ROSI|nr:hypothetical protein K2173_012699 [Erythroxylum novogranatense]